MNNLIRKLGTYVLPEIYVPLREDNKPDVCPVDAFAGKSFNINPFGHIQNDVSALMQAQSKSEYDLIAQRLVEVQGDNPDNSDLSDTDLFRFAVGRHFQTPAEVAQLSESITRKADERSRRFAKEAADKKAYEEQLAKEKADFEAFKAAQSSQSQSVTPKSE